MKTAKQSIGAVFGRLKECTVAKLQAALVQLIDLYNEQGKIMSAAIANKQDREWRATI